MNTNKKHKNKYKIRLCGSFWLGTPDNQTIPVLSKKSRALIAILATSENGECPRSVLQNKLWSRGSAKDSLRKELSNLRKLFNAHGLNVFPTNVPRDTVKFDVDYFDIDIKNPLNRLQGEFLEGLDIPCEEFFEDWLRTQRAYFETVRNNTGDQDNPAAIDETAAVSKSLTSPRIRIALHTGNNLADTSRYPRQVSQSADIVTRIINLLMHSGGIDLFDYNVNSHVPDVTRSSTRYPPHAELNLILSENDKGLLLSVQLQSTDSGKIVFSRRLFINPAPLDNPTGDTQCIDQFIVETVDEIVFSLTRSNEACFDNQQFAAKLVYIAIENLFKVTPEGLDVARSNLDAAIELDDDAVFYAWRAYTMTHYLDDPRVEDFKRLKEEATYYIRRALEIDPYNPLVLSLLTHVYSFGLKQFGTATELINKAKSLGSEHVMTHDAEALLKLYTGNPDEAKLPALLTTKLSRFLPYRHCFITTQCMIHGLQGNYEQAINAGELALSLQNNDLKIAYPPTVRYLAANYKMAGEFEKAFNLIESLYQRKRINPDTPLRHTEHIIPSLNIANFVNL